MEREDKIKRRGKIKLCLFIILLAVSYVVLRPYYERMVSEDRAETCLDARWIVSIYYHEVWDCSALGTELPDMSDRPGRARKIAEAAFHGITNDAMEVSGVCRAGGKWKILIDEDSGALTITCDAPGHEDYIDLFVHN